MQANIHTYTHIRKYTSTHAGTHTHSHTHSRTRIAALTHTRNPTQKWKVRTGLSRPRVSGTAIVKLEYYYTSPNASITCTCTFPLLFFSLFFYSILFSSLLFSSLSDFSKPRYLLCLCSLWSSVSSTLSSAAANCWEDMLKWKLNHLPETKKVLINRLLGIY